MKVICWILIISMFICSGCGSTLFVEHEQSSYNEINRKLEGKKGTITLKDGQKMKGENIRMTLDSTSWFDLKSKRNQILATSDVNQISIKSRCKGALRGFGLGLLIGGGVGATLGYLDGPGGGDFFNTPESKAYLGGGVGGLAGGLLLGLPIGAAVGVTDRYVISAPSEEEKEGE